MLTLRLSEFTSVACLFFIFLVPLAAAGLSIMNVGLGRSRSAGHMMMASLCALSVAAVVYFIWGFAWQGYVGVPGHQFSIGGKAWNWIAAQPFLFRRLPFDGSAASLDALFQTLCVGLAALIPLGSGADRWRLRAICVSTAVLAGFTYPIFAHWVWGGGWLAQLGVNYGVGRGFVDPGGASTIQVLGGLTALSATWILQPRRGKYSADGMAPAIPGHNAVLVLFGCLLVLVGWFGINSAAAILFTGAEVERTILVALNTLLCAAAGALAAAIVTNIRFGKPDASLTANGWVGGLAASSGCALFVGPAEAVVVGFVAGVLTTLAVEWFELRLEVDDPGGAVSVHAVSGLWGILALGIFGTFPGPVLNIAPYPVSISSINISGQWLAQVIGISTLMGFVLPFTYALNWVANRLYPYRVSVEGERQGMDLHELGAGAYPEFVTHTEDLFPR